MGLWVVIGLFIYYFSKYCLVGRVSTRLKFQNPLSEYLKYLYPYPSVYMFMDGRTNGLAGLVGRVGFHGFFPTPSYYYVHITHWPQPSNTLNKMLHEKKTIKQ